MLSANFPVILDNLVDNECGNWSDLNLNFSVIMMTEATRFEPKASFSA